MRLARKELAEILRDRRTMITLVLMPILVYPLLSVVFQQFVVIGQGSAKKEVEYLVGFASGAEERVFAGLMSWAEQAPEQENKKDDKAAAAAPKWKAIRAKELDEALHAGEVHLLVKIPEARRLLQGRKRDAQVRCELRYVSDRPEALAALHFVERRLALAQAAMLESRLDLPGLWQPVQAVRISRSPLAAAGPDSLISLKALVPLILILMTITGAVYPAIDLTAGERERGTLEILVAAPVPRLGLLLAKYFTVVCVAVLTALVNLASMTITLTLIPLGRVLFGDEGLSLLVLVQVFGLLLLFAAFFSAVLLCLTSFARSFKEAQAYLIPLMLLSLGPGLIGMLPDLPLADWSAVPLLNIVLLGRDLLEEKAEAGPALVVIVTTLLYALSAIALAARIFGSESVLYSDQGSWGDLWRRPAEPQGVATIPSALWCLALMLPLHFLVQALLTRGELSAGENLALMAGLAVLLFMLLPVLAAYRGRVEWRTGFGLAPARLPAWLGAAFLGCSLWPLVLHGLHWLRHDPLERLRHLLQTAGVRWDQLGYGFTVALAVTLTIQAVCEEFFFRGILFHALKARCREWLTILATALLFGLTHVVTGGPLGLERMLPSTFLGLVLGWVAWTAGSVFPGMILHASHNVILALIAKEQAPIPDPTALSGWWLVAGVAGALAGGFLMLTGRKPPVGKM